eukprot:1761336-Amphidinium_carterae.1
MPGLPPQFLYHVGQVKSPSWPSLKQQCCQAASDASTLESRETWKTEVGTRPYMRNDVACMWSKLCANPWLWTQSVSMR